MKIVNNFSKYRKRKKRIEAAKICLGLAKKNINDTEAWRRYTWVASELMKETCEDMLTK